MAAIKAYKCTYRISYKYLLGMRTRACILIANGKIDRPMEMAPSKKETIGGKVHVRIRATLW